MQPRFTERRSIGNDGLHMTENRYRGMVARITRGTRRGTGACHRREHRDGAHGIASDGSVVPDASSFFVVAEAGWQFGALAKSSPVQFAVPNRGGETVQVCGRAANVNDLECSSELSTVTRWQIGGSGTSDADVPPLPYFGLGAGQTRRHGGTERRIVYGFDEYKHDFGGHVDDALLGRTARAAGIVAGTGSGCR